MLGASVPETVVTPGSSSNTGVLYFGVKVEARGSALGLLVLGIGDNGLRMRLMCGVTGHVWQRKSLGTRLGFGGGRSGKKAHSTGFINQGQPVAWSVGLERLLEDPVAAPLTEPRVTSTSLILSSRPFSQWRPVLDLPLPRPVSFLCCLWLLLLNPQVSNAVKFTETGSIFVCVQVGTVGLNTLSAADPSLGGPLRTPEFSPKPPTPSTPFFSTLRRRFRSSSNSSGNFESSSFDEAPATPSTVQGSPLSKSPSAAGLMQWSSAKNLPLIQNVSDFLLPSMREEDCGEADPRVLQRFKEGYCTAQPGEKIRLLLSVEDTGIG